MGQETLLTIEQAATASGFGKKALRAMVRDGSLPAVRREGCWHVAAADLINLGGPSAVRTVTPAARSSPLPSPVVASEAGIGEIPAAVPLEPEGATPPRGRVAAPIAARDGAAGGRAVASASGAGAREGKGEPAGVAGLPAASLAAATEITSGVAVPRAELLAVLEMLGQRDAQIAALQDERARLYAQLGLLQGVLAEREGRLRPARARQVEEPRREDVAPTTGGGPGGRRADTQDLPATAQPTRGSATIARHRDEATEPPAQPPDRAGYDRPAAGRRSDGALLGAATMPVAMQRRLVHSVRRFLGL